ncbi:pleckstrin homology domain-containing family G member 1-like isoform X2 [Eucyclogobius newberryi]|uniref:pleckstrin homology domain-containing family G member 1-like isoform X2 n=1 Tax=Eucyclogobius newberryi TaxID=166745 RepID=UPI003B59D488
MPTDDYTYLPDALPPLPEVPDAVSDLSSRCLRSPAYRHTPSRYSSSHSMDSALDAADRPISYTSTSSSASSRDSHCSLGSRSTLVSAPMSDRDSGAIRLELVPARQLEEGSDGESKIGQGRQSNTQTPTTTTTTTTTTELKEVSMNGTGGQGQKTYVDRVVQEILDTERTYVRDLQSIVEDYLESISEQSVSALSPEDKGSLFGNIQDIYLFNRNLLEELERCNTDPVAIAECFVSKSEDFHIYTQYCTNYPRSVAVLTECMRNKALAKFFRERQECLHHSLPLGSFLLKPVQRILKYHLLLHEIANHLEKDTETLEVVQEAIDTMQRVAWHINDMKRKHEHAVRLQEIQSFLTNWKGPDLIGYGELVLEGTFRLQRAKNERTLFLFDKLLLITKKREETYTYKAHILCCNLMLVEVIPKEPLSFSVFHYKNPKLQHTVQAKSQQDKRMWILHLKRLILENHPAKIPAKAKQAILEMDAMHHPGFHYSPDGDKKDSAQTKEGPTRRGRRKEPLSKLLKNAKQNAANTDGEKRSSLGATLLSPVSQLALGTIGRSRSLINQSQESLDPCDHFYHSDREEGEESHQQDADDEDDSGIGGSKKLRVPGKGSRKRLNPQASVDSIDQWKTFNMSSCDLQRARESLTRDTSRHPPLRRSSRVTETPPDSPIPTVVVTQTDQSVNNIWADHRARRAMFPTRQRTMQPDEDEDIYQMFVPSEADKLESEPQTQSSPRTARPVSWHVEQVPTVQVDPPPSNGGRVIRRASSVGEKATEAKQSPESDQSSNLEVIHTESSSNDLSASSSAEQLTLDDIENVYDNISYEDLKNMGLVRRDLEEKEVNQEHVPVPTIEPEWSSESNRSSTQEARPFEIKVEEENIYDTISYGEPPTKDSKADVEQERDSLLASKQDLSESAKGFVSEESLQFEDETNNNVHPCSSEVDLSSSSASETFPKQKGDKLSERVDEIWNDLENYIKINEKKADRLPAAFPVNESSPKQSKTKSPPQTFSPPSRKPSTLMFNIPVINIPDIKVTNEEELANSTCQIPTTSTPEPQQGTVKSMRNRLARLSSGSFRLDEDDDLVELPSKSPSPKDLLFPGELESLDSPIASSSLLLGDSMDLSLELDKNKSRVFLMARQYSQKIKKANQLLRMRSMDPGDACSRTRAEKKQKDLAAILEEKKQGGAAIGARIAEYSQLYDQVMFPAGSSSSSSGPSTPSSSYHHHHHHHLPSSPSLPETSSEHDWLHSTYSNGELASFVSSSLSSDMSQLRASSTPQRPPIPANPASKSSQSTPMSQRWSSCVSAPSEKEEHVYSTIKRHTSFNAPSLPAKNQAAGSVGQEKKPKSNRSTGHHPGLGHTGRHNSLPESTDITLQDGQQIVVLNRNSALSILNATQNYFANFKDNGEDDDDYVEIRSEDESELDRNSYLGSQNFKKGRVQSHSLPSTPVRKSDSLRSFERHHLEKYLWNEQQHHNQPKIVQSLREKLQCLSSSSFA